LFAIMSNIISRAIIDLKKAAMTRGLAKRKGTTPSANIAVSARGEPAVTMDELNAAVIQGFASNTIFEGAKALAIIATAQAKAGDKAAARGTLVTALEAARNIVVEESDHRARALAAIATAQAAAGDKAAALRAFTTALETVRSIKKSADRAEALSAIAAA